MKTIYFLISYDRDTQQLVGIDEISDMAEAVEQYDALERQYADDSTMEIVLLGAASRSAIETTHSRYFLRQLKERKDSDSIPVQDSSGEWDVLAKPFDAIRGLGAALAD